MASFSDNKDHGDSNKKGEDEESNGRKDEIEKKRNAKIPLASSSDKDGDGSSNNREVFSDGELRVRRDKKVMKKKRNPIIQRAGQLERENYALRRELAMMKKENLQLQEKITDMVKNCPELDEPED